MNVKRLMSLLCALAMLTALVTGCGGASDDKSDDGDKVTTTTTAANNDDGNNDGNDQNGDAGNSDVKPQGIQGLTATKIGSINANSIYAEDGGVYYRDANGKYGILSADGKKDTGAIYADCKALNKYFTVSTKTTAEMTAVADLNCFGLVDGTGKQIIPAQYAAFTMIGDDYVLVYAVTERAAGQEDGMVYYNEAFAFSPNEDSVWFKAQWSLYDLRTGQIVPGMTGAYKTSVTAKGNLLTYVSAAKQYETVNYKGQPIPKNANCFNNGFYKINDGESYVVYNADGVEQFRGGEDDYEPYGFYFGYIQASKYVDGTIYYVLMNEKGEIVSAEFKGDSPDEYGTMLLYNGQLCTLDGTVLFEGPIKTVRQDTEFGKAWLLEGEDGTITCVDDQAQVLWSGDADSVEEYYHLLSKKVGDDTFFYSIADKDYTIKGRVFDRWLVKVDKPDYVYDLVDTISGKAIISGYESFSAVDVDNCMYIYAKKDGAYDVYLVK